MAFHQITRMDVWDIIRRWHDRHSIRGIGRACGYDRKTVRTYIRQGQAAGLSLTSPLPDKEEVLRLLHRVGHKIGRTAHSQVILLPYLEEIAALVNDPELALKPKSAFSVISERHNLVGRVSYPSYARFIRRQWPTIRPERITCRIEVDPAEEVQIDYARIGLIIDPSSDRRRTLFAFIATLSHSRMKYVEFTYAQDQTSFVRSHIRMFEFFGGVPKRIIIDNLKAGIIKADLYDPTFNRAYREMSEHYGCFIDPARVREPKDKGKVERDVQSVREAGRMILVQHPGAPLSELNRLINDWSMNQYGRKEHGTTHERPLTVLLERERPALTPLPESRFEPAEWRQATVHPDHYIQFRTKAYSIPHAYVGKRVWIRAEERILTVFFNDEPIKQHVITRNYRHTDFEDFPENVRAALDKSYTHKKLLERASAIGPHFHQLVRELLDIHAFMNLRRCMGLLGIAEGCAEKGLVERAALFLTQHRVSATPNNFRRLLETLRAQDAVPQPLPLSEATREFVRDITYFVKAERIPS